jgi:hypothetical protein
MYHEQMEVKHEAASTNKKMGDVTMKNWAWITCSFPSGFGSSANSLHWESNRCLDKQARVPNLRFRELTKALLFFVQDLGLNLFWGNIY